MLKFFNSFAFFVFLIIATTLIIFLTNNYTNVPARQALSDTKRDAQSVSDALKEAQDSFEIYSDLILDLYNDAYQADTILLDPNFILKRNLDAILKKFIETRSAVNGYFYYINSIQNLQTYYNSETLAMSHISILMDAGQISDVADAGGQVWMSIHNPMTDVINLIYAVPFEYKGKLSGFLGITIDLDNLSGNMEYIANKKHAYLMSQNGEILIHPNASAGSRLDLIDGGIYKEFSQMSARGGDGCMQAQIGGKAWLMAYYQLPTGQMFAENVLRSYKMRESNIIIWLMAVFSILTIFLVTRERKDGFTAFDYFSNKLMGGSGFTPDDLNRNRAALGLFVGMIGALISYMVYVAVDGFDLKKITAYGSLTVVSIILTARYRFSKSKNIMNFVVCTLIGPFIIHLMLGGFSNGATGEIIMWMMASVLIILFIAGKKVAQIIMKAFVLLMFFDALIEIQILNADGYGRIFTFITGLFFLGLSLYSSIEIYVTRSAEEHENTVNLLQQLKEAQSALVQKEKMATLGRLIAGIAHEINTPIGAIKASADLLSNSCETLPKALAETCRDFTNQDFEMLNKLIIIAKKSIDDMNATMQLRRAKTKMLEYFKNEGIYNAAEIVNKLIKMEICHMDWIEQNMDIFKSPNCLQIVTALNELSPNITVSQTILTATEKISKIVFILKSYSNESISGGAMEYDIEQSIDNVLILYNNLIQQGIQIEKEYEEGLPMLTGNSDELSQVWTNIIHNAIQAMNGIGILSVSIKRAGSYIEISFKDTGCGIDKKDLEKIFEPLYTTKPLGEGSGLGLDVCKKIITSHNGTIEIESKLGEGTVVKVKLPL